MINFIKYFIYVSFDYFLRFLLLVPVAWVFMASIKENSEFYGNPWSIPAGIYLQNFVNAFEQANMGEYLLNSILTTAMALVIFISRFHLPAAYVLARL